MSRSRKKPIWKDRGLRTEEYWRRVRRHQKNNMRSDRFAENERIDDKRSIVNDYDKCDYVSRFEHMPKTNKDRIRLERIYSSK